MNSERIVSLLPSATEILFALGAGDRVVGVTHECDYPTEAKLRPHLTASSLPPELQTYPGKETVAFERRSALIDRHVRAGVHAGSSLYYLDEQLLERLAPGLIVTQELCAVCAVSYEIVASAVKRLREDPRIISLEPSTLRDVFESIETLGEIIGAQTRARAVVRELNARLDRLAAGNDQSAAPSTLVLEWSDPPMSAGHWIADLIEIAGGAPVLANPGANSRTIAFDEIAASDPEVIIVAPCGYDLPTARASLADLERNERWPELRAVQSGRVYAMDGSAYVSRPGPRLVDTAELFAMAIRGERILASPALALV